MSTRAVYTFIGDAFEGGPSVSYHVYKHHDGYPSGAAQFISAALSNAWKLPRFEPDEFAASFIAANKEGAGGVRLTSGYKAHGDLEYRYEIRCVAGVLHVTAFDVSGGYGDKPTKYKKIFQGTLDEFDAYVKGEEGNEA